VGAESEFKFEAALYLGFSSLDDALGDNSDGAITPVIILHGQDYIVTGLPNVGGAVINGNGYAEGDGRQ
jgi:hypothetical protein